MDISATRPRALAGLAALLLAGGCARAAAPPTDRSEAIYVVDDDAFSGGLKEGTGGAGGVIRADRGGRPRAVAGGLPFANPEQLAWAGGRRLVVSDTGNRGGLDGAIYEVDAGRGRVRRLARGGYLSDPRGVAARSDGEVLVVDRCGYRGRPTVIGVARDGRQRIVTVGGRLRMPLGAALSPTGELLVADMEYRGGAVLAISPRGGRQRVVAAGGLLRAPLSLAVARDGVIYVGDRDAASVLTDGRRRGAIIRIDRSAARQRRVLDEVKNPEGLSVTARGELLIAGGASRVDVFDPRSGRKVGRIEADEFEDAEQAIAIPAAGLPPLERQPRPEIVRRRASAPLDLRGPPRPLPRHCGRI